MKKPLSGIVFFTLVLCCITFLFNSPASGQQKKLDSLIAIATSRNTDMVRLTNPDSVLNLLAHEKSPAARIKHIYDIILLDNGELDPLKALYYHHKILDVVKKTGDEVSEAVITCELGYAIAQNGDGPQGLKLIYKALALAEKTGNQQAIGVCYDNLAVCANRNTDTTIMYLKKAVKFSAAGGDELFVGAEYRNLSDAYKEKHDIDSARYFIIKCFEISVKVDASILQTASLLELGQLAVDPAVKFKYYRAALQTSYPKKDASMKGRILVEMATEFEKAGKRDSALYYAANAVKLTEKVVLSHRLSSIHLLARLYTGDNADSALKYTTLYYTVRDSLYSIDKVQRVQSLAFAERQRQQEAATEKEAYQTRLRLYLLTALILFFVVLAFVFWRSNSRGKKANALLKEQKDQVQRTLQDLKITQNQLIQSEKMASLGELTAGIAHEIQNPLNFVNNFSEVNIEMIDELKEGLKRGDVSEVLAIAGDIQQNEEKINHHGKRVDAIVKGMLQHSRAGNNIKEPADINKLVDEYLRLAYHGLRAKNKDFNAELITHFDEKLPKVNIVPQDIGRVLLNVINNAFYAVQQKAKTAVTDYRPTVEVTTLQQNGSVLIIVKDNGPGIPDTIKDKIMQPFFTTKPTGEGTGLGLSLSYDIVVKGHGGAITLQNVESEGAAFTVTLPLA